MEQHKTRFTFTGAWTSNSFAAMRKKPPSWRSPFGGHHSETTQLNSSEVLTIWLRKADLHQFRALLPHGNSMGRMRRNHPGR